MVPVVIVEALGQGEKAQPRPVGQLVGVRVEMRAEPGDLVVPFALGLQRDLPRIVITILVGVAAHDPVAGPKATNNLAMGDPAQAMIGLVRDLEVALVQIDQPIRELLGQPRRGLGLGAIQADDGVVERQLVAAPVAEDGVIVLGDQQAIKTQRHGWRRRRRWLRFGTWVARLLSLRRRIERSLRRNGIVT